MIGIVPYSEEGLLVKRILESYVPEEVKRETIVLLLQILERIPYAVVGGFAVSFYYKGARPVSPDDFDVKVLPENLEDVFDSLKLRGFVLKRKNFFLDSTWYVFERAGQGVDIGVAKKPWDVEGIKRAKEVLFKGIRVRMFPPEYLIVSKLYAGRPKDLLDIAYIVKGGKADIDKARKLVRKFLPSDLEDFESIVLYAQRFDDAKLKEIFGIEEVGG